MKKKKVLFFIESLSGGGAEKVLITVLQHLNYLNFEIGLLTVNDIGVHLDKIDKNKLNYYTICGKGKSFFERLLYRLIYHILPGWLVCKIFVPKGYDIYIAFVEGYCTKILSHLNKQKIAWVHCDLSTHDWPVKLGIFSSKYDEAIAYSKYDKVICVSKAVENIMLSDYGLQKTQTIYNPIDEKIVKELGKAPIETPIDKSVKNIVSVGRLVKQKGYDQLLPIIKNLSKKGHKIHLWIIGDGEERNNLTKQVEELEIKDLVTFTGYLSNPYALMSKMDIFVCSSRTEGYSLVIAEAMILEIPVISINCSGPRELIGNNRYGTLCSNYNELEFQISKQLNSPTSKKGVPDILNINKTIFLIESLLNE